MLSRAKKEGGSEIFKADFMFSRPTEYTITRRGLIMLVGYVRLEMKTTVCAKSSPLKICYFRSNHLENFDVKSTINY